MTVSQRKGIACFGRGGVPYQSTLDMAEACHEIMKRLDENHFALPHKELIYRYSSHLLLPIETSYAALFRVGRQFPEECRKTAHELQAEVLEWLKKC